MSDLFKRITQKLLHSYGYKIVRLESQGSQSTMNQYDASQISPAANNNDSLSYKDVLVGKFVIKIHTESPLIDTFDKNPQYTSELGRLTKEILTKYPNLVVLDIGANVGDTMAIVRSSADVPIICIEGDETCYKVLCKNASLFDNITIFKLFLGERTETKDFIFNKVGWNTTLIPSEDISETKSIELTSLDEFVKKIDQKNNIKLVKIDTEGFDTKIIRGGLDFFEKVKPVIQFEYNRDNMHDINEDGLSALYRLKEIGYDRILFYESGGRFMFSTLLTNESIIKQMHNYADGCNSSMYYLDLCLFHKDDNELAENFIAIEESHLLHTSPRYKRFQ